MKCNECSYKTILEAAGPEHTGSIMCKLTKEEHAPFFECNCEQTRIKRDKEARIKSDGVKAVETLTNMRDKLFGPKIDLKYIYDTLTKVSINVDSPELCEVIDYIVEFL